MHLSGVITSSRLLGKIFMVVVGISYHSATQGLVESSNNAQNKVKNLLLVWGHCHVLPSKNSNSVAANLTTTASVRNSQSCLVYEAFANISKGDKWKI